MAEPVAVASEEKPKKTGWRGPAGSINKAGRPPAPKGEKPTNRELRERELMMLLRKIRPHVASAVSQAAKIMQNDEASHMNQLKAATILLDAYRKLTLDVYDGEEPDAEGTEIQEQNNMPVFSLRVLENKEDK
jgi:hypothetical protein